MVSDRERAARHPLLLWLGCILTILGVGVAVDPRTLRDPPTAPELIAAAGYPVQVHTVQTADGYLLEVHRIPPPADARGGPPVLLLHGLRASSAGWIINPRRPLPFMLSDAGYDVWLGNNRGNLYSQRHVNLETDTREYWNFTADSYAKYDNPAFIDYILQNTGENELFYVGYSISTWSFWAMMNYYPSYNTKVRLMVAMAPISTRMYYRSFAKKMVPIRVPLHRLAEFFGMYETMPYDPKNGRIGKIFCNKYAPTKPICAILFFMYAGWDPKQLDKYSLPVILTHVPAGCGNMVIQQLDQAIKSGNFQRFDYGPRRNQQAYGQPHPTLYYPENVTAPVVLLFGKNDKVADRRDVASLASRLPNLVASQQVAWPLWQHLDFLWGIDADRLVYRHVLQYLADWAPGGRAARSVTAPAAGAPRHPSPTDTSSGRADPEQV
ncbi:lipase 3-like [Amphibalanus amphitrite]|uniref:lipase 3-like n=1 Tax=Amphibalanus amphitrite TaxID=1232801 RepID=UPI001C90C4CE|nr:lipase 3-like [Amphibalanus amphitrite]